jgi:hypothetical protein
MNLYAKPYSEACEQNKEPILAVLREVFSEPGLILEIGAGTGQHAVHFARELPHLDWQPTDRADYLPGIQLWIAEAGLPNLRQPLELDTCREPWPIARAAGVFFRQHHPHHALVGGGRLIPRDRSDVAIR